MGLTDFVCVGRRGGGVCGMEGAGGGVCGVEGGLREDEGRKMWEGEGRVWRWDGGRGM